MDILPRVSKMLADLTRSSGLNEKILPTDEIFITIRKSPSVLCFHCGGEICYVKDSGRPANLENFAPLQGKTLPGWDCPNCGKDIRAWLPEGAVIKTNKGIMQC